MGSSATGNQADTVRGDAARLADWTLRADSPASGRGCRLPRPVQEPRIPLETTFRMMHGCPGKPNRLMCKRR